MSPVQIQKAFAAWPQVELALRVPRNERGYRQLVKLLDRLIDEVGENEGHPPAIDDGSPRAPPRKVRG